MNDCFWYAVQACDCCEDMCKKYISINKETGSVLTLVYENQINQAIQPVRADWKRLFRDWSEE